MMSKIVIQFRRIKNVRINKPLINKNPKIMESTKYLMSQLISNLNDYFKKNDIDVIILCEVTND